MASDPDPDRPASPPPEAGVPPRASQSDDDVTFMILVGILAVIALIALVAFFLLGFGRP